MTMALTLYIVLFVCIVSFSDGYSEVSAQTCQIPVGTDYEKAKFSLTYHSDHLGYSNIKDVFDKNWNFLPGVKVQHGLQINIACVKDTYGDAIHKMERRKCLNGSWSRKFPDCTMYVSCSIPELNITGAMPAEPIRHGQTFDHNSFLQMKCGPGFDIRGNSSLLCSNGTWTKRRFSCVRREKSCGVPKIPGMMFAADTDQDRKYPNNHRLAYKCGPGWYNTGSGVLVCKNGGWSDKFNACSEYKAPIELSVTNVTATSNASGVYVSWQLEYDQETTVRYFRVLYTRNFAFPPELWDSNVVPNDTYSTTLRGLTSSKTYKIAVAAGDGVGEGPPSNINWLFVEDQDYQSYDYYYYTDYTGGGDLDMPPELTPDNPDYNMSTESPATETLPPCPDVSTYVYGNNVTVTWDQPPSTSVQIVGYFIEYTTINASWQLYTLIPAPSSSWELVSLEYGQDYRLRINPDTGKTTKYCDEVSFTTDFEPCSTISIPDVGIPVNMTNDETSLPHGYVMTFKCDEHEELQGDPTVVCQHGTWSDVRFKCKRSKPCFQWAARRSFVVKLIPKQRMYAHGSKVRFTCKKKRQKIFGVVTCNDGKWSKKLRICKRRRGYLN